MVDIAIIGAGPAGLSAAINGVIRNKKVLLIGRDPKTSYLYKAEQIDNYLGMNNMNGPEMINGFVEHGKNIGVEFKEGRVTEIFSMGDYYAINVENEFIEARTIILATGIPKGNYLDGEENLLGKGVSYCATCDGMLYRGKNVVVVGDSKEAEEEVDYLAEICKKVYYFPKYKGDIKVNESVEISREKIKTILGDEMVKGIMLSEGKQIDVDGVFLIKESIPAAQLIKGIEMQDKFIKVNRMTETNFPGVYAAGDITGKPFQVAKAIGEGNIAALQAVSYMHSKDANNVE